MINKRGKKLGESCYDFFWAKQIQIDPKPLDSIHLDLTKIDLINESIEKKFCKTN